MKKVIICGSISAADEIIAVQKKLEAKGYEVETPEGVKHLGMWGEDATTEEKTDRKIKHDLIRLYYEKIKVSDIVLVVNPEKKGIAGYIGGNTFLEWALPIFCESQSIACIQFPSCRTLLKFLPCSPLY